MDKSMFDSFKEKNSVLFIKKLSLLLFKELQNKDNALEIYSEIVLTVLEIYQQDNIVEWSLQSYLKEKGIKYEAFRTI